MSMYSQLYVLPFYESSNICFNLASGLILMGEFDLYTTEQLLYIFIGCLISICGISLKLQSLEAYDHINDNNEDGFTLTNKMTSTFPGEQLHPMDNDFYSIAPESLSGHK